MGSVVNRFFGKHSQNPELRPLFRELSAKALKFYSNASARGAAMDQGRPVNPTTVKARAHLKKDFDDAHDALLRACAQKGIHVPALKLVSVCRAIRS